MAKIEGMASLKKKLKDMAGDAKNASASATVGFTQRYALHVHENTNARHDVGMAKFLEIPARTQTGEIVRVVTTVYKKTRNMLQALIMGGIRLHQAAEKLTPVDTSALKSSGFVCPTSEVESKSAEAFARSENVRLIEEATRRSKI